MPPVSSFKKKNMYDFFLFLVSFGDDWIRNSAASAGGT
jgi:hypothetical protein